MYSLGPTFRECVAIVCAIEGPSGSASWLSMQNSGILSSLQVPRARRTLNEDRYSHCGIGLARIGGGRSLLSESTLCTRLVFQYIFETCTCIPLFCASRSIEIAPFLQLLLLIMNVLDAADLGARRALTSNQRDSAFNAFRSSHQSCTSERLYQA
ncbi:hypothetical protein DFP72DRAFT_509897 [Ephemerocybe angulata]|uniref:Uncharacterized protein n=1 Tax=Ephemerocybe angulata TaxID=980116 RepID=A0A8H6HNX4_9AGAR|nr:hypothetical protein DFP72DRAFT_509897 [Tulosesus angulatus]